MSGKSVASTWSSTATERAKVFPCDRYLSQADGVSFRTIDVQVPAHTLFQWLCQLRVAPSSYDWLDNRGRQSPRHLNPDLENLEVGQRVMSIFKLVEFEPDRHLTLVIASKRSIAIFGEIAVSYVILPKETGIIYAANPATLRTSSGEAAMLRKKESTASMSHSMVWKKWV